MKKSIQFLPRAFAITCISIVSSYASIANAAQCEHVIQNEWSSGFVAEIQITNDGTSAIEDWQVNWSYSDAVSTSTWNAVVSGNNPLWPAILIGMALFILDKVWFLAYKVIKT